MSVDWICTKYPVRWYQIGCPHYNEQIYRNVWNEDATGGESTVIVYHIRNIRRKLGSIPALSIQCVRELGYCMEVETEELQ